MAAWAVHDALPADGVDFYAATISSSAREHMVRPPEAFPMRPAHACSPLVAIVGTLSLVAAARGNWPEFRGPAGDGLAPGPLPRRWSDTENVAWKTPVAGLGWSSPVVHSGQIGRAHV